ncbi:MAG: YggS family pyridoxal phosphate-dependent enzyme [Bacteroidia bacterium]|nr:YggS family pyridoxal phosphate-dependent enzyme [Bacteroidia bacterium]NNL33704.1 YggS family pyridoxal phosphate-dependent enzyme [Flavobacteriaceae bacterium]
MNIEEHLNNIKSQLSEDVTLVAVSKTQPVEIIQKAYDAGQRIFGENKIQEMVEKQSQLPDDIEWHMIGHVQRNKVKYMAEFVHMIHGVESLKLLKEINKQAKKYDRIIACLLQIKIATEDTKFGMTEDEALSILRSDDYLKLNNVKLVGVMGMATFTNDKAQVEKEFKSLKQTFDLLKIKIKDSKVFEVISMGMSGDFKIALSCGSNMVRIGSSIFGSRN